MKKGLVSLAAFTLALAPVKADGFATINVEGKTQVNVGETITVKLNLHDINETKDGVVAIGGDLKFDNEYLEYLESSDLNNNYKMDINEKILRIAGVDYTLKNGIKDDSAIYSFTFKVLKDGETSISFENAEIVDVDASEVVTNNVPLNITINKKEEVTPIVEEVKEVKTPEIKDLKNEEKSEVIVKNEIKEPTKEDKVIEEAKEELVEEKISENKESFVSSVASAILNFFNIIINLFK